MKTKANYQFIDFIRPGYYWPWNGSIEQAFGVFRWMIDTGEGYEHQTKWGKQTVESLLSRKPSCTSMWEIEPVSSLDDLRQRFHYAILSPVDSGIEKWRQDNGITINGKRTIVFPHANPMRDVDSEANIKQAFDNLFAWVGRLNVELNEYHSRAREIYGVQMHYSRSYPGWRFVLSYGFDGSIWRKTIARQRPKELLLPVLRRAIAKMEEWTAKGEGKVPT